MTSKNFKRLLSAVLLTGVFSIFVAAQVTTSEIVGRVVDAQGKALEGVTVEAVHQPTGTNYVAVTNDAGRFALPNLRVGGPYTVKVVQAGFKEQSLDNVQLALGTAATLNFTLTTAITETVNIESNENDLITESKTGASTAISSKQLETLPTISRRISDFTRLTPQASGSSFAGQDNRLNNITVDGSYFNNSFGLGGQPGDRTGVSPISLDAIEAIQVNVSPYDVRQGNFVGAGVNTVTRSGTNTYSGSAYYLYRKPGLVGKNAGALPFPRGNFNYKNYGFRFGGPLPFFHFGEGGPTFISGKNKLFFFTSYENEELTEPGTTFTARTSTAQAATGSVTRVLQSDLDTLSAFLKSKFNYDTGPYQGYSHLTPAKKFLLRGDYNANSTNRISLRYIQLRSSTDVLLSNSSSLGFGTRRSNNNGLNFQNSNYQINENIDSMVGEWDAAFGSQASNSLIVGYTKQDESRTSRGSFFPMVDILEGGSVYTTFGFEPFTPNNELRYNSFQIQDNLTFYRGSHTIATGFSYERYKSENVFFPGSQSAYVYNSLADFYTDANNSLANPSGTTSPVNLRRFQVRWSNIPGLVKPVQPLKVDYLGAYGQDTWKLRENLSLTYGIRADVPFFGQTGFANAQVDGLNFRDEKGATVKYSTSKLPDSSILWSPRVGFNYSPLNSGKIQMRGGTGIFTARPAYVWISNQIGNNGILTGFAQFDNTVARPFRANPDAYKPASVTGAPASSYELALTEPNFKFPQIWRSSIATDVKIPLGLVGGVEYIYSKDVNGVYYVNTNLPAADSAFVGVDARPRWLSDKCTDNVTFPGVQTDRINCVVTNSVTLKNQNIGKSWNMSFTLEKPYSKGLWAKAAYSYGNSKNTVDPGSIASGSWQQNQQAGDPNNPGLGYSGTTQGHRFFATASYRKEYLKFGATTVSMFLETRTIGNASYVYSGDLNGDTGTANDLIYIPKDISEMNFSTFTTTINGVATTFTAAQQADAWEAYIKQDKYLSANRGKYAQRGAVFMPLITRMDFSLAQDIFAKASGSKHSFQIRADILNFGNLLNKNWGVGQSFLSTSPLTNPGADATGKVTYRLRVIGNGLINSTYTPTNGVSDVYRIQLGFRYTFN